MNDRSGKTEANVLVVEDDEDLRVALEDNLRDEGYRVKSTSRGRAALELAAGGAFDLVILDVMLPDLDGYAVCRKLREGGSDARVLMLTARTLEDDVVTGLDVGADDYMTKPYRLRELLARVRALVRRGRAAGPLRYRFGSFVLDISARQLRSSSGVVDVTKKELDLLALFLRTAGEALSRDRILDEVWGRDVVVDGRTVDNFVSSLKRKLGWSERSPFRIDTVRGVGYRFEIR